MINDEEFFCNTEPCDLFEGEGNLFAFDYQMNNNNWWGSSGGTIDLIQVDFTEHTKFKVQKFQ